MVARPEYLPKPFADLTVDKNVIPENPPPGFPGNASLDTGFPPITKIPSTSGGLPPLQEDFNGAFYQLYQFAQWQQAGGQALWDVRVNEYPINTILFGSDGIRYQCIQPNGSATTAEDPVNDIARLFWKLLSGEQDFTVNNIVDLKKLNEGRSANVLGYYDIGDGGGGPCRILETSSPLTPGFYPNNGGTSIWPDGGDGSVAWIFNDNTMPLNIREFGAKGDGVSDDATIIKLVCDLGADSSLPTYMPSGNYLFSFMVQLKSNTTVYGDGDTTSLHVVPGWTLKDRFFEGLSVSDINISKMKFNCDLIAQAVTFFGVTRGSIENCLVREGPPFISTTIHIDDDSVDIRVKANRFDSCQNYAISVNDSKRVAISDNISWGYRGRIGLNSGAEECSASNNTVLIESFLNGSPGMTVSGINCSATGNIITKVAGSPWTETGDEGIGLGSAAVGNTITANVISGFRMGVRCSSGAVETTITANTISDCKWGVGAELGAGNVVISSNIITDCTAAGILSNFVSCIISSNQITTCLVGIDMTGNNRYYTINNNVIQLSGNEAIVVNIGTIQAGDISNNMFVDIGTSAIAEGQFYAINGAAIYKTTVNFNKLKRADNTYRANGLIEIIVGADNIISNNDIIDASVGNKIAATSAQAVIYTNKGWRSENSGTATVLSGTTSVQVAHGCEREPSLQSISVTALDSMGSAIKVWVSNLGATFLTINVDQDPGVDADFSWAVLPIGS